MTIYVNVALSNSKTCVCCDEDGNAIDCCLVGEEFGGMYHPDGVEAAQTWAAEHVDLMRELTNQVSSCCAGKCQVSTEDATSSLQEDQNDTDANNEERTVIVDIPLDGTQVTIGAEGVVQSEEADDPLVVVEIPEGTITKSGNLSDPEPGGNLLLDAGVPEAFIDELLGAGLDTPEKVLAFDDLSSIKGIGSKTKTKILRILNEGE